ncbi:MAG: MFS transporter [Planctomycetota bacterium]
MPGKGRSIILLVLAQTMILSLWFVSSAILSDMGREAKLDAFAKAAMSSSVQAGFVLGALTVAITGIADKLDPRFVLGVSAAVAGLANLGLLVVAPGGWLGIGLRFFTGIMLAGVYPVGMKIAVGWGQKDRGFLVGLLVGGLTVGSASPHLLAYWGGAYWRLTVGFASALAFLGAGMMAWVRLGPFHRASPVFSAAAISLVWKDSKIRAAYGGYLGHMWELYAMWAWISVALASSFSGKLSDPESSAKMITFITIAAGGIASAGAGWVADQIGKAKLAMIAMLLSSCSALAFAACFNGPIWLVASIAIFWGITIVPDSAQFSALIADFAPPDQAGSVMTLQTALGFALTAVTVQIAPVLADNLGWPLVMASLAIGPMLGIVSMSRLSRTSPS